MLLDLYFGNQGFYSDLNRNVITAIKFNEIFSVHLITSNNLVVRAKCQQRPG